MELKNSSRLGFLRKKFYHRGHRGTQSRTLTSYSAYLCVLCGKIFFCLCFFSTKLLADKSCLYLTEQGQIKQVRSLAQVPDRYRATAQCSKATSGQKATVPSMGNQYMAAPQEIDLKGNVREEYITSSIGPIRMRWPRKVETLFGRTPQRAMADAATTVSRVLKGAGFTTELQKLHLEWQVVFMDEDLPTTQIPQYLVSNCHPAWMTPPANVYVVAQRVVAGCGNGAGKTAHTVADSDLAKVLLHELGHGVEGQLLHGQAQSDHMRAEGFASWFEQYSSNYSAVIPKGSTQEFYFSLARSALARSTGPFVFQGSAEDYARASLFFHAVVERRGVRGLMQVYQRMLTEQLDFITALKKEMGWSDNQLGAEMVRVLK